MNNSPILTIVLELIGILGVLGTLLYIPDLATRAILLFILSFLLLFFPIYYVYKKVGFKDYWAILTQINKLGIKNIVRGNIQINENMLEDARQIRIMALSGIALIQNNKPFFIKALQQKVDFFIMLGTKNSILVEEVEEVESIRSNQIGERNISEEISQVRTRLIEYYREALHGKTELAIGHIYLGSLNSQLRLPIILLDDKWGWLTLTLPPHRSSESVTIMVTNKDDSLFTNCLRHFDDNWQILKTRNLIENIK